MFTFVDTDLLTSRHKPPANNTGWKVAEGGNYCPFSHLWLLLVLDWPLSWTTSRLFLCGSSSRQRIATSRQHCHSLSSSKISPITYWTQSWIYSSGSSFYSRSPKQTSLTTATAMQIYFLPLERPSLLPLGPRTSSTSSFLPLSADPTNLRWNSLLFKTFGVTSANTVNDKWNLSCQ